MSMRDHLKAQAPRSKDRSSTSIFKILSLGLILFLLLAIIAFFYFKGISNLVRTDPTTLCPIDRPPSEVMVILLDMSDEFTEPQKLKIQNELTKLQASVSRFGLIEAYAVDSLNHRVTRPVIHLCNPGTGDDLNRIYQNPELARLKWKGFMEKLNAELDRLMNIPQSWTSPIFEAIQATALRTFNRPDMEGVPKRLVIVSDLLQNVPGKLSHYVSMPSFEEFKQTPYFSEVRCDLKGVSVTLLYLVRPTAPQKWPDHKDFWEQYFLSQGAIVQSLEPVYGGKN